MLNHSIVMGRLTRDVEIKETPNGRKVVNNTVACPRDSKDEGTDFIDITVWGTNAENMAKYFSKGSMIIVEGRQRVENYTDKDGKSRKNTTVNVEKWHFCEAKKDGADANKADAPADPVADAGGVQFPW